MTLCFFSGAMIDCLSFEKRGSRSGHLSSVSVHIMTGTRLPGILRLTGFVLVLEWIPLWLLLLLLSMESKRLETYDKIDLSYRTGTFNIVNAKSFCVYQLETKSVGRSFAAANPGLSDMFRWTIGLCVPKWSQACSVYCIVGTKRSTLINSLCGQPSAAGV
jgi:hypothetical protein